MATLSPRQAKDDALFSKPSKEQLTFLLNFAVLAPSTHNTQPWLFRVEADYIDMFVDDTRWLKVADADKRELHVSVGCALENLVIAAEHYGFHPQVTYFPDPTNPNLAARVELPQQGAHRPARDTTLFNAIRTRHTNHRVYDGAPVSDEQLETLEACVVEEGLELFLTSDPAGKRRVDTLMMEADARQFADPAWRNELGYWLGAGAFGQPWLLAKLGQFAVTYLNVGKAAAKKDSDVLLSAPVLGVLASQTDDRTCQLKAGRAFERVFLTAESLGLRLHPMNQVLQIPELKQELGNLLPKAETTPQIAFRLGYAEAEKADSPRRPLEEVLVT